MKISKKQFKAALNVAHEAGFNSGFECTDAPWVEHNFGNSDDPHNRAHMAELIQDRDKVVKRIVKHEVEHAKARKLQNARKHWNVTLADHEKARGKNYVAAGCGLWSMQGNVAADYVVNLDLEKEQDNELKKRQTAALKHWEKTFLEGGVDDEHNVFIAEVLAAERRNAERRNAKRRNLERRNKEQDNER